MSDLDKILAHTQRIKQALLKEIGHKEYEKIKTDFLATITDEHDLSLRSISLTDIDEFESGVEKPKVYGKDIIKDIE